MGGVELAGCLCMLDVVGLFVDVEVGGVDLAGCLCL